MDTLSTLYESDDVLSENDDSLIESNWRKLEDYSASARELLSRVNADIVHQLACDQEAMKSAVRDPLIDLEHTARLAGDVNTAVRIAEEICAVYFAVRDYQGLVETTKYLMQCRGQSHQAQTAIISKILSSLSDLGVQMPFHGILENEDGTETNQPPLTDSHDIFSPAVLYANIGDSARWDIDEPNLHAILIAIRSLTQGKLHLELEFAQISMILAAICDRKGDSALALRVLQKVTVERLSALSKFDKTQCLVYQLALSRSQNNYVAFARIARKVSRQTLENPSNAWLLRVYLLHFIEYFTHFEKYFATFLCYRELFECNAVIEPIVLRKALVHLLLAQPENEDARKDTIECTIFARKYEAKLNRAEWITFYHEELDESHVGAHLTAARRDALLASEKFPCAKVRHVLQFFVGHRWTSVPAFTDALASALFGEELPIDSDRAVMFDRLAEQNILILSRYYTNITIARLAAFVEKPEEDVESMLRAMVSQKLLRTKIDRVDRVVEFPPSAQRTDIDALNESVKTLLDLVQETCHLIEKERLNQSAVAAE